MSGHVDAPSGKPLHLNIPAKDAAMLAFYSATSDFSVLAPRGWHCINIYGSNGSNLFVTPGILGVSAAADAFQKRDIDGPAVVLTFSNGFTSGRDEVASVVSRVFPAHLRIVRDSALDVEVPIPKPAYRGPFPGDRLRYISHESLEYVTPAGQQGLGTLLAPLHPTAQPITGAQILVRDRGDCCHLISLAIRLPSDLSGVVHVIQHQVQRDSMRHE